MKLFSIILPSTILENTNNLLEKTLKLGQIARIAGIFKISKIFILKTNTKQDSDLEFIKKILEYLNTPQYLRKKKYSIDKDLKHVGRLPPLATYLHHLSKKEENLKNGEIREGLILESGKHWITVDIGIEFPLKIMKFVEKNKNEKLFIKILKSEEKIDYSIIFKNEIKEYLGYDVRITTLTKIMKNKECGLILGTSKKGVRIFEVIKKIKNDLIKNKKISLIFGSAKLDIFKLFKKYNINIEKEIPYIINFLPNQGVRTIRTEEAMLIALSSLYSLLNV